eukprot:CAMPEP_0174752292 /NCGR_PEP_ID=MMETSP1094-20130205/101741_1 /TAXON_ID=156173 /ORGANISM="Chrysochromulina brevifilum, Strain UTEX LB 985" /LENGTH=92 /DNA_ID=CAMNT_0015957919 /DNA_START=369 /DNA_END=644 /DNA_ORIENTATION=-
MMRQSEDHGDHQRPCGRAQKRSKAQDPHIIEEYCRRVQALASGIGAFVQLAVDPTPSRLCPIDWLSVYTSELACDYVGTQLALRVLRPLQCI